MPQITYAPDPDHHRYATIDDEARIVLMDIDLDTDDFHEFQLAQLPQTHDVYHLTWGGGFLWVTTESPDTCYRIPAVSQNQQPVITFTRAQFQHEPPLHTLLITDTTLYLLQEPMGQVIQYALSTVRPAVHIPAVQVFQMSHTIDHHFLTRGPADDQVWYTDLDTLYLCGGDSVVETGELILEVDTHRHQGLAVATAGEHGVHLRVSGWDLQPTLVHPFYSYGPYAQLVLHWHPTRPWLLIQLDFLYVFDVSQRQVIFQGERVEQPQWDPTGQDEFMRLYQGEVAFRSIQIKTDLPDEKQEGSCLHGFEQQTQAVSTQLENQRLLRGLIHHQALIQSALLTPTDYDICKEGEHLELLLGFWVCLRTYRTPLGLPPFTVVFLNTNELEHEKVHFTGELVCALVHALDNRLPFIVVLVGFPEHSTAMVLRRQFQDEVSYADRTNPQVTKKSVWEVLIIDTAWARDRVGFHLPRLQRYIQQVVAYTNQFLGQYGWTLDLQVDMYNQCLTSLQNFGTCTPASGVMALMILQLGLDVNVGAFCRQLNTYWHTMRVAHPEQAFDHLAVEWYRIMKQWMKTVIGLSDTTLSVDDWTRRMQVLLSDYPPRPSVPQKVAQDQVKQFIDNLQVMMNSQQVEPPERVKRRRP